MLKRTLMALTALSLVFAAACGPNLQHVRERMSKEAELLQAEVASKNLGGDDVETADRYLAESRRNSKQTEAAALAELAAAFYRTALARHSVEVSANALSEAEAALKESQELVAKYQDLLTRVNANAGRQ